jgi:hypothetical protein
LIGDQKDAALRAFGAQRLGGAHAGGPAAKKQKVKVLLHSFSVHGDFGFDLNERN